MKKVVIISTPECVPCKQLKAHLSTQVGSHQNLQYLDVSEADQYKVRSVPTTYFFDNDLIIDKVVGYKPEIVKHIKSFLE